MTVFSPPRFAAGISHPLIVATFSAVSMSFAAALPLVSSPPSTHASTGKVAGKVAFPSGQSLPEMIVFLEPSDPALHYPPPKQPVVVSQRGGRFAPPLTVVCVGQTVEFVNDEESAVEHNVFSQSPTQSFDLGLYPPGVTKSVTFEKTGPVRLHCSIHRNMDGVVYVCPTPFFAKVAADGSFVIEAVPPGSYMLRTWQRRQRFLDASAAVTVTAGDAANLNLEMSRK